MKKILSLLLLTTTTFAHCSDRHETENSYQSSIVEFAQAHAEEVIAAYLDNPGLTPKQFFKLIRTLLPLSTKRPGSAYGERLFTSSPSPLQSPSVYATQEYSFDNVYGSLSKVAALFSTFNDNLKEKNFLIKLFYKHITEDPRIKIIEKKQGHRTGTPTIIASL